jgi:hypothetical protein
VECLYVLVLDTQQSFPLENILNSTGLLKVECDDLYVSIMPSQLFWIGRGKRKDFCKSTLLLVFSLDILLASLS